MVAQVESTFSPQSVIINHLGKVNLVNQTKRSDGYGNFVNDHGAFELSKPNAPEIFSVIPKGDRTMQKKKGY
ncbi:hypothetical protein [Pelistega suis]|uniref:hypothetical protein n=1 Tax=Pelistega suis TaxID=1631957 RepID=UPI00211CB8D3|nr:hypothetical protein [Pelistega suis]MCQ9328292.1 hypothetical protein [Pelistega suis]